ncbi:hypothetical protein AVEN_172746-1 [Araneus ventricosus]|uniref:HTH CENPB-type domain-containing protein n=1 Tax=Araneus ventricosus TaxID=182803 RepID=A0A4Y2BHS8_ARAVE|nr:hypothetical protein AVEN_172746-1 [Araneus ventricosus]
MLNISLPLLNSLLKFKSDIETAVQKNDNLMRKRKRCGKYEVWFLKVREKDARVSGPLLRQKAKEKKKWAKDDFQALEGWFHRWKKRENITS